MYELILVNDEEEVRKGMIQKIEWSKFNFEITGEAENGREALDLISLACLPPMRALRYRL